jgi:para-nitrobenzyl esterase
VLFIKTFILMVLLLGPLYLSAKSNDALRPEVRVNGEILVGEYSKSTAGVAVFRGIPFAAPPINERRWQAPQKHSPRVGKQESIIFAPACFQDDYNTQWYQKVGKAFGVSAEQFTQPEYSEDCLYLNIWKPAIDKGKKLPVMVWIHGGSNKGGWSYEKNYIGDKLAARGEVIVVSIAYRLGVFGFFSHPELANSAAPANFGLLDQIAALKWIKQNIAEFGGDNTNITVFGESAGAANIGNLMLSPLAEGLFHRAISQSGGFQLWRDVSLSEQQTLGAKLSQALGSNNNTLLALKSRSAEDIFTEAKKLFPNYAYGAVIDGKVLPDSTMNLLFEGSINVDLLVGSNQDEWLMYLDDSPIALEQTIGSYPKKIQDVLFARASQESSIIRGHDQVSTMIDMVCPAYEYAKQVRKSAKNAYVYRFQRVRNNDGGKQLQAYHGAEIPYVFDSHDDWFASDNDDHTLTTAMVTYWTNFAKNGDPNSLNNPELPQWPLFNEHAPMVQVLSEKISAKAATDFEICQKISPYLMQKP